MREIQLTQGYTALIDDEDFDRVNKHRWHITERFNCRYAITWMDINGTNKRTKMHRFILGAKDGQMIDHIDGNGINNCRDNLRFCTASQNQHNKKPTRGVSSKYKGVGWYPKSRKWRAYIRIDKIFKHIGHFDNEIEAAHAYDQMATKHFGEFAWLNFPDELGN